ncbi:hypothetical protein CsSME_00033759 [Camellia sinensis var. sinensis]
MPSGLWVYAYFPRLAPEPEVEMPLVVLYSHRYDVRCERRPRESFLFFRRYFDTIATAEITNCIPCHLQITWQPWAVLPDAVRDQYMGARETAQFRVLLEGPIYRAWYLGERFLRQTLGLPEQIVPRPPSTHMRHTERDEGDYTNFIQTYLMRPLTDAHRTERERPATLVGGAGASRATQAHSRRGSRRGQRAEWPNLPTTMTCCGQAGETYQITIAPHPADHELVEVRGSTPLISRRLLMTSTLLQASIEYTGQALELKASVMGMLQRSTDLLGIYGIPAPFQIPVAAGMSIHSRGRHRRTRTESSSREPTPDDDESDVEAESSQDEAGDGSGSDSGSGGNDSDPGPSSKKRTRRDSRT